MESDDSSRADSAGVVVGSTRQAPTLARVLVSGLLVGFGVLTLARGLHTYLHFHSYATGIATSRLYQALFWSATGGILLSVGVVSLLRVGLRSLEISTSGRPQ